MRFRIAMRMVNTPKITHCHAHGELRMANLTKIDHVHGKTEMPLCHQQNFNTNMMEQQKLFMQSLFQIVGKLLVAKTLPPRYVFKNIIQKGQTSVRT